MFRISRSPSPSPTPRTFYHRTTLPGLYIHPPTTATYKLTIRHRTRGEKFKKIDTASLFPAADDREDGSGSEDGDSMVLRGQDADVRMNGGILSESTLGFPGVCIKAEEVRGVMEVSGRGLVIGGAEEGNEDRVVSCTLKVEEKGVREADGGMDDKSEGVEKARGVAKERLMREVKGLMGGDMEEGLAEEIAAKLVIGGGEERVTRSGRVVSKLVDSEDEGAGTTMDVFEENVVKVTEKKAVGGAKVVGDGEEEKADEEEGDVKSQGKKKGVRATGKKGNVGEGTGEVLIARRYLRSSDT